MEPHLATVFESIADAIGGSPAVVQGDVRRSWAELDDRAARLASAFLAVGMRPGAKVAAYLYNSPEYLETYLAALKIRAVPVNVNYRYQDDELLYLLDNSEAEALVFHSSLGDRVGRIRSRAPRVRLWVEVDDGGEHVDGTARAEDVLAAHDPAPRVERAGSDITMTYTGGTTGMPKGVMTHVGRTVLGILESTPALVGLPPIADPAEVAGVAARLVAEDRVLAGLPACPLMHATGMGIGALPALMLGGTVVLLGSRAFDPAELWATAERERVIAVTIVGDAFARPMLRALQDGPEHDLSSLRLICSSGAMFSAETRAGLLDLLPQAMILDFVAATEGVMGTALSTRDAPAATGTFRPSPGVTVFTEDDRPVLAGSGEAGMLAVSGEIPDGYFHDPAKTAATFRVIDGVRYSLPGDWATVAADGSIELLGRGSQCINTGGEKVYPEEVEEALKRHGPVEDCLVFGLPDERFGQRIVAVAAPSPGSTATAEELLGNLRRHLASFKVPRALELVAEVPRAPNGKADYGRAREIFGARAGADG